MPICLSSPTYTCLSVQVMVLQSFNSWRLLRFVKALQRKNRVSRAFRNWRMSRVHCAMRVLLEKQVFRAWQQRVCVCREAREVAQGRVVVLAARSWQKVVARQRNRRFELRDAALFFAKTKKIQALENLFSHAQRQTFLRSRERLIAGKRKKSVQGCVLHAMQRAVALRASETTKILCAENFRRRAVVQFLLARVARQRQRDRSVGWILGQVRLCRKREAVARFLWLARHRKVKITVG